MYFWVDQMYSEMHIKYSYCMISPYLHSDFSQSGGVASTSCQSRMLKKESKTENSCHLFITDWHTRIARGKTARWWRGEKEHTKHPGFLPGAGAAIVAGMIVTNRDVAVLNVPSCQGLIDDEQFFVVHLELPNAAAEAINLPSTWMNLNVIRDISKEYWPKGNLQRTTKSHQQSL